MGGIGKKTVEKIWYMWCSKHSSSRTFICIGILYWITLKFCKYVSLSYAKTIYDEVNEMDSMSRYHVLLCQHWLLGYFEECLYRYSIETKASIDFYYVSYRDMRCKQSMRSETKVGKKRICHVSRLLSLHQHSSNPPLSPNTLVMLPPHTAVLSYWIQFL